MYNHKITTLDNTTQHLHLLQESIPLTYAQVIQLWQTDLTFTEYFITLLVDCPFLSFRWETPAVTTNNINQSFQCVLIDSPDLAKRSPDTHSFKQQFAECNNTITSFDNLGGDAHLIVPIGISDNENYIEIATFSRNAPHQQQLSLWQHVGKIMQQRISHKPIWLSTAGGGVAWLHMRLDSQPKYYAYAPYYNIT